MDNFKFRLEKLETSFKSIASTYRTDWERRAVLDWVALAHELPRSEVRKLFDIWQLAQPTSENKGGGTNG